MYNFFRAVILSSIFISSTFVASSQHYTPGVLRVKFKENIVHTIQHARLAKNKFGLTAVDQVASTVGVTSLQRLFREGGKFEKAHHKYGLHLWYEIRFDERTSLTTALKAYQSLTEFEIVERLLPYQAIEPLEKKIFSPKPSALPTPTNDPLFVQQWHYENKGQSGGTTGADISLAQAWATQTGNPEVIVAVIDGGIDILHPDLTASLWINTDEIAANNKDDDNNGYIDDVNGYGFGDNMGTIYPHYHGTHVAGTIAAVTNNNIGVSGIAGGSGTANGVRLMSCAGFGSVGVGGFEDAMVYAADNGAVISQNSWGGGSSAIEAAIDYFIARAGYDNSDENFDDNIQIGPMAGGIVIFAAGNSNTSETSSGYPASYAPNMAVASTDHNDQKSYFSNYGSWVDIAAPGSDVFSTFPLDEGSYAILSGTSMACPHVSGVAALIISQFKGPSFSPNQVWDRLQFTADDIDDLNVGYEDKLGSGRVNAFQALQIADDIPPAAITNLSAPVAKLTIITLQWTAPGASGTTGVASFYDIRYSTIPITEANFSAATQVARTPRPQVAGTTESFEVMGLTHNTTYYFAIKARDFFGNVAAISNIVSQATPLPPVIQVTPSSVAATLLSGEKTTRSVTIQNTGGSTLSWSIHLTANPTPGSISKGSFFKPGKVSLTGFNNSATQVTSTVVQGQFPLAPGEFKEKKSSPMPLTCLAVNPTTGIIYAQGNQSYSFFRYDPNTNDWFTLESCPLYSGNNGGAAYLNGKIYTVYADNPSQIGIYSIADNTWSTIANNMSYSSTNIASDGKSIFIVGGAELRKYAPETSTWTILASPSFYFEAWGSLSYYDNALYGHQGNSFNGFGKYDILTNTWTTLQSIPGGAVKGSAIDLSTGTYFTYGSYGGNNWYAYDITEETWSIGTIPNFNINDGGLVYVGLPGVSGIFFVQGEIGEAFSLYETEALANWLRVDSFSGDIPPSSSKVITATLDASDLIGGTYQGAINITHNDPVKATVVVPVALTVIGAPDVEVNYSSIHYGDVYVGAQRDSVLTVTNNGSDDLSISSITIGNINYVLDFVPFTLNPTESKNFTLTFRPASVGTFNTTLTLISNDPDESTITIPLFGKGLLNTFSATPSSFTATIIAGQQETKQISILNGGTSPVNWSVKVEGSNGGNLNDILSNLQANFNQVTSIIPNRFDFEEGHEGHYIGYGGSGMYNGGNFLTTDVGGDYNYLYYTTGAIQDDARLGSAGKYFTAKYPGLFVMAADVNINSFLISGYLGASGSGLADGTILTTNRNGKNYKGFVKRVYNAGGASVNHLIIMEDNGVANHNFDFNTYYDNHGVTGLSGVNRLYYLLFSTSNGEYINDASMQTIMSTFLKSIHEGVSWINVDKNSGSLVAGGSQAVNVVLNANAMDGGIYHARILVSDNIPFKDPVSIPVTLTVIGRPDIALSKSTLDFGNVLIGGFGERTVSLKNLGSEILNVSSITVDNKRFNVTPANATVNAHDSVRLTLGFYPTATSQQTGSIRITSDDPDEKIVEITLVGAGATPPVAEITPAVVDIKAFYGERKFVYLKIKNTGGEMMNWNLYHSLPYGSNIDPNYGEVPPNESRNLKLTIDSYYMGMGSYNFYISLYYNSPVQPQVYIPINITVLENHAPIIINSIVDQTLALSSPAKEINLAENFFDQDSEPLRFNVSVESNIIEVNILGSELELKPKTIGETYVTVWATDALGERADSRFKVSVTAVTGTLDETLTAYSLSNHPNPFNGTTTFNYSLKAKSHAQLIIQDVTGRLVETLVNEDQLAGEKVFEYKNETLPSGLYFYQLRVNGKPSGMGKMVKH